MTVFFNFIKQADNFCLRNIRPFLVVFYKKRRVISLKLMYKIMSHINYDQKTFKLNNILLEVSPLALKTKNSLSPLSINTVLKTTETNLHL